MTKKHTINDAINLAKNVYSYITESLNDVKFYNGNR
jgi:hypothetical protein